MTSSKPVILIADDEVDLREVLLERLTTKGFQVIGVGSAEEAVEVLKQQEVSLVLSDLRMGEMTGLELLAWIKENKPKPVLLMTGYGDVKSTEEALNLGADGFLPKPFRFKDLLETISNVLGNIVGDKLVHRPEDFRPVPISTFLSDCEIPFHVYLKMTKSKFIKIAYSGEDLSEARLNSYRQKGITELYLLKEDHSDFLGFATSLTSSVVRDSNIPIERKKDFIKAMGKSMYDKITFQAHKDEDIANAGEFISSAATALVESDEIFSTLEDLMKNHDYLYAHSVSVSVLSFLLAKTIGWKTPENLFLATMAGLLHDIAKKEWPDDLVRGDVPALTPSQKEMVENHALKGAELLEQGGQFLENIIEVVRHHHDNILGEGPGRISAGELPLGAQVVGAADWAVNIQYQALKLNKDPKQSLRAAMEYEKKFSGQILDGLTTVFGFEPFRNKKFVA